MTTIKFHEPVSKNRFYVLFFKEDEEEIISILAGEEKLLTMQLTRFLFDSISREFELDFRLPRNYIRDLESQLNNLYSFTHFVLDGTGISEHRTHFIVDRLTHRVTEYGYDSGEPVEIKVKGIYK